MIWHFEVKSRNRNSKNFPSSNGASLLGSRGIKKIYFLVPIWSRTQRYVDETVLQTKTRSRFDSLSEVIRFRVESVCRWSSFRRRPRPPRSHLTKEPHRGRELAQNLFKANTSWMWTPPFRHPPCSCGWGNESGVGSVAVIIRSVSGIGSALSRGVSIVLWCSCSGCSTSVPSHNRL